MSQGLCEPAFRGVATELDRQLERSRGGSAVCVYHRGRAVVDLWGGQKDWQGSAWTRDTMSVSFSTTKGATTTLLHMLVDRGLLRYSDPVAEHWPEFAQAGKQKITVRNLLCHQAGLYGLRDLIDSAQDLLDWTKVTEALSAAAPADPVGSGSAYHALSYGYLVGELIQRVARKSFGELIRSELAEPLDLDGFYVGVPETELGRVATLLLPAATPGERERTRKLITTFNTVLKMTCLPIDLDRLVSTSPSDFDPAVVSNPDFLRACIPAVNGTFTARSLARMYAALAGGGELDGVRLLSRKTLKQATRLQVRGLDRVIPIPMRWRLGYHPAFAIGRMPKASFGHFGYGGSGAWADPVRKLAVAFVVNTGGGSFMGDDRIARINGAALKAADNA